MEYLSSIVLWVIIIGFLVYKFVIQKNNNRKAAETGEDQKRVKQAVSALLKEPEGFQVAYAHWEEQESYGRTVRTTYHRYGLAFRGQTLCIVPLGIDKKTHEVQTAKPMVLTPENLGKVTIKTTEKDGVVNEMKVWLGDKQGHVIQELNVDVENLRKSRWFPMNIAQQEECKAFYAFIGALAQQVARENPGVDALIQAESNEGLGLIGTIISGIGAVFAIFFPPIGLVLCLVGLIMAVVSKVKGATSKKWLLISGACMVVALIMGAVYFSVTFQ